MIMKGDDAEMYVMRAAQCHNNCELLLFQNEVEMIYYGLALSEDGMWREHSWGYRNGNIVETTVKRVAYAIYGTKAATIIPERPVIVPTTPFERIENMAVAICIVYNHMTGRSTISHATADSTNQVHDSMATQLPACCVPHIKRRTRDQDNFISLVFPQDGTELIMVYIQRSLKKVIDTFIGFKAFGEPVDDVNVINVPQVIINASIEALKEKTRQMLDRYMLYDYSFVTEVLLNRAYQTGLRKESYQVVKDGTITVSGKEFARYYIPSLPPLPEFHHESLSKLVAVLRGTFDSGDTVTITKTELDQFMFMTGNELAAAMASGHMHCCGCTGH